MDPDKKARLDEIADELHSPTMASSERRDWRDVMVVQSTDEAAAKYIAKRMGCRVASGEVPPGAYLVELDYFLGQFG